jgi:hypothetical protein
MIRSQGHAGSSQNLPRQIFDSVRKTTDMHFVTIDEIEHASRILPLTGYAHRTCVSSGSAEKSLGLRNQSSQRSLPAGHATAQHAKGGIDGLEFHDLASSLEFPSSACIIMDNIASNKSSVKWNIVLLRVQRTAYSPRAPPRRSP